MAMSEEHKARLAEGRRKAAAARKEAFPKSEPEQPRTVEVTYTPIARDDPHFTKWNGILFKANVPVTLDRSNPAHYYEGLLPEFSTHPMTGQRMSNHVPAQVFMGDAARGNPSFIVDGQRAQRKVSNRVVPPPGSDWTDTHESEISNATLVDESMGL